MLQTYADIYEMCNGRPKSDGSKTISRVPCEYIGKPVFTEKKMMIKENLNIFFHKDIIELILNYISDIKVSTSGISPNLRSNYENFIDTVTIVAEKATRHNQLEENDIYWQEIAQKDFGNIMIDMSYKGDFDTWKEYYNYLCFMFMNNHYSVSRIDDEYICIFGDYLDAKRYSGDKIQQLLNQYKRGDMIYCRGTGGEQYYVDSISAQNNVMMYGAGAPVKRIGVKKIDCVSFKSIEEFPVTYWRSRIGNSNNIIENNVENQPFSFVYPESLGIKLTKQDIKEITINRKQYKYFVFEHQNINYCLEFTNNTDVRSKSFYDFSDVNFWNKKQKFLCRRSCSEEQGSKYKDFLDYLLVNYKITLKQLLITTSNF